MSRRGRASWSTRRALATDQSRGIVVFDAVDEDTAQGIIQRDPAATRGVFRAVLQR
ncbi:MAG TPA: YciI family protein [bacterium]|nr:YciI family protein [bacterium]